MIHNIKYISFAVIILAGCSLLVGCGGSGSNDSNPSGGNLITPNTFSFTAQSDVPLSSLVTSAEITVTGINKAVAISIMDGEYSINNANFTTAVSQVVNGDKVKVRHESAATYQSVQKTQLTIGGVTAVFSSTTVDAAVSDLKVSVSFPLDNTKIYTDKITIYGNASSTKGIENIQVNGINASMQASAETVSTLNSDSISNASTWSAEVPLASASNTILTVKVTEADGVVNDSAATLHISNQQPPVGFTFDPSGRRLIGQLFPDGMNNEFEIISIDVETDKFQSISKLAPLSQPQYVSATNSILYSTLHDYTYVLYSLSLDTTVVTTVFSHTFSAQPGFHFFQLPAFYDAAENSLYVGFMRNAIGSTEYGTAELYSISLADSTLKLIAGPEKGSGGNFYPLDLKKAENKIIAIDVVQNYNLISIDLVTGDRMLIAQTSAYVPMRVALHPELANTAYVAGLSGIAQVDLMTGTVNTISSDADYPDYNLSQVESLAVDLAGNRLLIGESDFKYIMATDLSTGVRSIAYNAGVGEGRKMVSPSHLAYDAANNITYVWDHSGNNNPALLQIDMLNGDRTLLAEIDGIQGNYAGGLHLDKANERLILQYPGGVIAYNLKTASIDILASDLVGTGPLLDNASTSAFDEGNNVLWIAAKQLTNQLYRVNLTDLSRELVTFDGSAGNGGNINSLTQLALDKTNNRLFMADSDGGKLYQLNLTDMSSTQLNVLCNDINGRSMIDPNYYYIGNMYYDSKDNALFISSGLVKWNLDTQSCDGTSVNSSVFDLTITPERRTIATRGNRLIQLDTLNHQEVVISR